MHHSLTPWRMSFCSRSSSAATAMRAQASCDSATVDRRLGRREVVCGALEQVEQAFQQEEGGAVVHGPQFSAGEPLNATQRF